MRARSMAAEFLAAVPQSWVGRYGRSFSFWGLAIATLFFAASLTPSLLPRHFAVQGVLSGLALAVGYGVGVLCVYVWRYLELPKPNAKLDLASKLVTAVCVAIVVGIFLWRSCVRAAPHRWSLGIPSVFRESVSLPRGPPSEDLSQFWGKEALQPLRVYVGMRTRTRWSSVPNWRWRN
jgi:uncharacterized membrane protein